MLCIAKSKGDEIVDFANTLPEFIAKYPDYEQYAPAPIDWFETH